MYNATDVTLYVPCYNSSETLAACVSAVEAQTARPARVLVVDDGSSEELPTIPSELISHPGNAGLATARNTALGACRTPLIAGLDADVVPDRRWLEMLLCAMNDQPVVGVAGRMTEAHSGALADRWRAVHMCQHWGDRDIIHPRFLYGANTLFVADELRAVGGYDVRHRTNDEDRYISDRLYDAGRELMYVANARCTHLRVDDCRSVLRGYWRWHHMKGLLRGDFEDSAGLIRRIETVSFGIWRYRLEMDLAADRRSLVALDMCLPWVFSAMDLDFFAERSGQTARAFPPEQLLAGTPDDIAEVIRSIVPRSERIGQSAGWYDDYVAEFLRMLEAVGWRERVLENPGLWRELAAALDGDRKRVSLCSANTATPHAKRSMRKGK